MSMSIEGIQKYIAIATQMGQSKSEALAWATDMVKTDNAEREQVRRDRAAERAHEKDKFDHEKIKIEHDKVKLDLEAVVSREAVNRLEKESQRDRERLAIAKEQDNREKLLEEGRVERERIIIREKAEQERNTLETKRQIELDLYNQTNGRVSLGGVSVSSSSSSSQASCPVFGQGSLKLPPFSDNEDIVAYINRFEKLAELTKLEQSQWPIYLGSLLTGHALKIFSSLSTDNLTYQDVKSALLLGFAKTPDNFRTEFKTMRLGNETCTQYYARLKHTLRDWLASEKCDYKDPETLEFFMLYDQFLASIPSDLRIFLKERSHENVDTLLECGDLWLSAHPKAYSKPKYDFKPRNDKTKNVASSGQQTKPQSNFSGPRESNVTDRKSMQRNVNKSVVCYDCGQAGHVRSQCKTPKTNPNSISDNVASINFATIGKVGNEYMTCGTVNGLNVSTIVRDTACEAVLVSNDCLPNVNLDNSNKITVCDFLGKPTSLPVARCYISCPFFEGFVNAIKAPLKYCSVLIGNVKGASIMKLDKDKHGMNIDDLSNVSNNDKMCNDTESISPSNVTETVSPSNVTETISPSIDTEIDSPNISVVTRQGSKVKNNRLHPLKLPSFDASVIDSNEFKSMLLSCPTLASIRKQATQNDTYCIGPRSYIFKWIDDLLYQVCTLSPKINEINQALLVVPKSCRYKVLSTAHENLISGHFSHRKTLLKVRSSFYWPGMGVDVTNFCKSCDLCQRFSSKGRVKKVPLEKMPLISEPFYRVSIDLVGPFSPPSEDGHQYILTLIDSATGFPEAVALKKIDTITVADALLCIFSRVGIPKEIHSDLGAQFASDLMKELYRLLGTQPLYNSPYHPMGTGRIERLHSTLKASLRKLSAQKPKDWHRYLTPVLFALREMPSDRTGFSSFELLYGRQVRGPVTILRELWENPKLNPEERSVYQHVIDLKNKLKDSADLAIKQSEISAAKYKHYFDLKTQCRSLEPGDEVLVLLPSSSSKLLMAWLGPFKVISKRGNVDYIIDQDGKERLYHINLLKKYHRRSVNVQCVADRSEPYLPAICQEVIIDDPCTNDFYFTDNISSHEPDIYSVGTNGIESMNSIESKCTISPNLDNDKKFDVHNIINEYSCIFSEYPGCTNIVEHEIKLIDKTPVRAKLYPVPLSLKSEFITEIESLKEMGIIRPSQSDYCAPCLMIAKKDGGYRLAIDYRALNAVTKFDAEPSCSLDEELHKFDNVQYFSELDICKAYYQVKLTENSTPLTAFATPLGLYEFVRMPFGLVTACATYVRLMRKILEGLDVSFYFDNIIIYSKNWTDHISSIRQVFDRLKQAGLTVKPEKCSFGVTSLDYLGFTLSNEGIRPQINKVNGIRNLPIPTSKSTLRSFIGLCSFYSRFIPHFSDLTAPLTDLLKKGVREPLVITDSCVDNFYKLLECLESAPILKFPCINKTFVLRTDASGVGIGAMLLQYHDEVPHPISFVSRKLLPRETNYSTIERELLAVVHGIQKFNYYLFGRPFILETDHQPLVYLRKFKGSNARLMRWALALQAYEFRCVYIPGKDNFGPDFLSRNV